jgi:glycosyltransferase involved in cell wall biosynthesis
MGIFLTVFIPAYNEEHNLPHCVQAIQAKLLENAITYEILIVNRCWDYNINTVENKENLGKLR